VLRHKETGEVLVVELKTTSASYVNAAQYKNSAQAVGYSIVLDAIFPTLSAYTVKYLIYKTKAGEFEIMDFEKDYLARALWLREILLDLEYIGICEKAGIYPMHGESCNDFYRECEYFNLCTMDTMKLTEPLSQDHVAQIQKTNSELQIKVSLEELIAAQLARD
jgi:hypothetical protein